jgi:hypothetical protein
LVRDQTDGHQHAELLPSVAEHQGPQAVIQELESCCWWRGSPLFSAINSATLMPTAAESTNPLAPGNLRSPSWRSWRPQSFALNVLRLGFARTTIDRLQELLTQIVGIGHDRHLPERPILLLSPSGQVQLQSAVIERIRSGHCFVPLSRRSKLRNRIPQYLPGGCLRRDQPCRGNQQKTI